MRIISVESVTSEFFLTRNDMYEAVSSGQRGPKCKQGKQCTYNVVSTQVDYFCRGNQ